MKNALRRSMMLVGVLVIVGLICPSGAEGSGFTDDLAADLTRTGGRLVQLANAVPADKFGWAPNEEVRTVSRVYMHVVGTNMLMPVLLGAAPPEGLEIPENPFSLMQEWEGITDKDEVIAKLEASVAYATKAVHEIEDLDTQVELFGFPASKRAYLLILLTHAHEHLGQSIAYARSIGVVPPWSQKQADDGP